MGNELSTGGQFFHRWTKIFHGVENSQKKFPWRGKRSVRANRLPKGRDVGRIGAVARPYGLPSLLAGAEYGGDGDRSMEEIVELDELLEALSPRLLDPEFAFCTVRGKPGDFMGLNPVATFAEAEGLSLVLEKGQAEKAGLPFKGTFRQITLDVRSSVDAVGLTAAVATKLALAGISANVVAAFHHDHVFVPAAKAEAALAALKELGR